MDGVVVSTAYSSVYGNLTIIAHQGSLITWYAHQSAQFVSPGQAVSRGQTIGQVGATGFVTGPHLHFEIHLHGIPYDPLGWFGGVKAPVPC
jgi:murein DD-endopeptidase MepM/ murein hydrolase activator NlpD